MLYIKINAGGPPTYPYVLGELRVDFPNTSFSYPPDVAALADFGVFPVSLTPLPDYNRPTQKLVEQTPVLTNGVYTQVWSVQPLSAQEQQTVAAQIQNEIVAATQERLDTFARTRNYDGILSLCTYATSPTQKFADEGQYGITARDATWAKLYEILAEVQAGTRPMPSSYFDIEPDLPPLAWPTP